MKVWLGKDKDTSEYTEEETICTIDITRSSYIWDHTPPSVV